MSIARLVGPVPAYNIPVLRFPDLRLASYFRTAGIALSRGLLPATKHRLVEFLNRQELDPETGHVLGMRHTDREDGGLILARRYSLVHQVGEDRFWDDLRGLYRLGWAEQVVKPAPGRRAVYALCLRVDAIPRDLPEDLARELRVWDLPEPADPYEDACYGHLTEYQAGPVEPVTPPVEEPAKARRLAAEMAAAPRWEHPAGTPAARVASTIRETAKALGAGSAPDLKCTAVADPLQAATMAARVENLLKTLNGKPSPLYARAEFPLSGPLSADRRGLRPEAEMEQTKTTPTAAPTKKLRSGCGDDLGSIADRVQRRAWAAWRAQLGYSKVFLHDGDRQGDSRSLTGSAWSDLHRTITIALRRSTESELVEVLSANVEAVDDIGRLAAWRLWRLINSRRDAHGYGHRREVPQAVHATRWDNPTAAELQQRRAAAERAQALMDARRRADDARIEAAAARRTELSDRWDLRRWSREPESLHLQQLGGHGQAPPHSDSRAQTEAAALARARAEKRARRREEGRE